MTDITIILEEAENFRKKGNDAKLTADKLTYNASSIIYSSYATVNYLAAIYEQNKAIIALLQDKKGE